MNRFIPNHGSPQHGLYYPAPKRGSVGVNSGRNDKAWQAAGLGQTAGNPILTSIKNFRHLYEEKIQKEKDYDTGFDLSEAVKESCEASGRVPNLN